MADRQPYLLFVEHILHYNLKTIKDSTFAWNTGYFWSSLMWTFSNVYIIQNGQSSAAIFTTKISSSHAKSYHISQNLTKPHHILSNLIESHQMYQISSNLIIAHQILQNLTKSHRISLNLTISHWISPYPTDSCQFSQNLIESH